MPRPTTKQIHKAIVPRIKEINARGLEVYYRGLGSPMRVFLVDTETGSVPIVAPRVKGMETIVLNNRFYNNQYSTWSDGVRTQRDYTVDDILDNLEVDVTLYNYKDLSK